MTDNKKLKECAETLREHCRNMIRCTDCCFNTNTDECMLFGFPIGWHPKEIDGVDKNNINGFNQ